MSCWNTLCFIWLSSINHHAFSVLPFANCLYALRSDMNSHLDLDDVPSSIQPLMSGTKCLSTCTVHCSFKQHLQNCIVHVATWLLLATQRFDTFSKMCSVQYKLNYWSTDRLTAWLNAGNLQRRRQRGYSWRQDSRCADLTYAWLHRRNTRNSSDTEKPRDNISFRKLFSSFSYTLHAKLFLLQKTWIDIQDHRNWVINN